MKSYRSPQNLKIQQNYYTNYVCFRVSSSLSDLNSVDSLRWSIHLTLFYGTSILKIAIINLFLSAQDPLYFNQERANYIIPWYTVAVELVK